MLADIDFDRRRLGARWSHRNEIYNKCRENAALWREWESDAKEGQ